MNKTPKVKLIDVARVANVSAATISRLVSGQARLDSKTRNRVVKASVKLGFEPRKGQKVAHHRVFVKQSRRAASLSFISAYGGGSLLRGVQLRAFVPAFSIFDVRARRRTEAAGYLHRSRIISGVIPAGTNSQNLLDLLTPSPNPRNSALRE